MRRISVSSLIVLALALAITAAGSPRGGGGVTLSLVAYSTPKEAYGEIISAFQATSAGKDVSFTQSYGASSDQARAVAQGLPADVVHFSTELDIATDVNAGVIARTWKTDLPNQAVPTTSIVVFVVRSGNPKHIRGWDDLVRPGVQVVTPNPFSSGAAKWNVMAAYGYELRHGKTRGQALQFVTNLFRNVVAQDKSGRDALNTFLSGKGDVLLTYENEAKLARINKQPVFYIIPKSTLEIDAPVAVVSTSKNKAAATAFARFLFTPTAQTIFAKWGYRPTDPKVLAQFKSQFPARPDVWKINYLGGWYRIDKPWFDPQTGIMAKIERQVGGSTG
jgi:sulfate transport system substrate-binding protein